MNVVPRRSALYLPGSNIRAIEKARSLPADVIILDLEDAVLPENKEAARDQVIEAIRIGGFGRAEVVVRVNAFGTDWWEADMEAFRSVSADAILLPKVSDIAALRHARMALGNNGAPLWAMIETPRAIVNLPKIADSATTYRLTAFVAGTNDLAKEIGCRPRKDRGPLLSMLSQILLVGRMASLVVLDGVCSDLDDLDGFEAECRQGADLGFDGKTLIHPSQIVPAHKVFTPADSDVAWARQVVAAFQDPANMGRGAIRVAGKMVEGLHHEQALRTIALSEICARK